MMIPRKWILPLIAISLFIFVLSFRQLSDPDLGFHLKYGQWITTHHAFPTKDISTFSVSDHDYIDLHWLFQVILFNIYATTGYPGISLFICLLSLSLSLLLMLRNRYFKIPWPITGIALFIGFIIIEARIAPRPEMFSFLFLTILLFILDKYYRGHTKKLFLLPLIMLFWCNLHSLFILGLIVIVCYGFSILHRDRKPDWILVFWMVLSFLVCFVNPYGIKGFLFPFDLISRFSSNNIYNQHIQEFTPFFSQSRFYLRDYLFFGWVLTTFLFFILTWKNRKIHEIILLLAFSILAFTSIRNIPLFILVSFPIISRSISEWKDHFSFFGKTTRQGVYILLILIPLVLIPRIVTNSYYFNNNSFNKFGWGINKFHQPVNAAAFLLDNHLNGRILNSIGFGGWLSWALPQPIFIDGRLEVMEESIYREITQSWNNGLSELIGKYHPDLIVYNYLKYYPWTIQLKELPDWQLIYVDGNAAIFAKINQVPFVKPFNLLDLPDSDIMTNRGNSKIWIQGFYQPVDYKYLDLMHLALFRMQMKSSIGKKKEGNERSVAFFNSANEKYQRGDATGALADYDSAILLQPDYYKAYNNRGIIRALVLKDYSGAISDFDKALDLNPNYGDAFLGRGTANYFLHNLESACRDWYRAQSLGNQQAARLISLHCNQK
ncbi:MAG: hypothetical protein M0P47_01320 [Bacteroidales bacterium]|nr:hypothetical protein [Bacteroidales bacterium]